MPRWGRLFGVGRGMRQRGKPTPLGASRAKEGVVCSIAQERGGLETIFLAVVVLGGGGEEEEEEGLFKADAVNEEEEEEEEEEESLFKADAVNEEDPERDRATQV